MKPPQSQKFSTKAKNKKIWTHMDSLINDGQYEEAREYISEVKPKWLDQCETRISHSKTRSLKKKVRSPKEEAYEAICKILAIDDIPLSRGSTITRAFFMRVIEGLDLEEERIASVPVPSTKSQLVQFVIARAGLSAKWAESYSSAGGTITGDGAALLLKAVEKIESEDK